MKITPLAANLVSIALDGEGMEGPRRVEMFLSDDDDCLHALEGGHVVVELGNGKCLEFTGGHENKELLVWGGREPQSEMPLESLKGRTESLGIYPMASNVVHVFPFKVA